MAGVMVCTSLRLGQLDVRRLQSYRFRTRNLLRPYTVLNNLE